MTKTSTKTITITRTKATTTTTFFPRMRARGESMAEKKTTKSTQKKKDGRGGKRPGAGNPALTGKALDLEPGDNARFLKNAMAIMNLPSIDVHDPDQVAERINEYFTMMFNDDMKPTVPGFAMALGMSRQQVWSIVNDSPVNGQGAMPNLPPRASDFIKKGYAIMGSLWEDYMQNGKINPVSGIFLGKNHWGYKDQQETVVVTPNLLGDGADQRQLEQKYLDSVAPEE